MTTKHTPGPWETDGTGLRIRRPESETEGRFTEARDFEARVREMLAAPQNFATCLHCGEITPRNERDHWTRCERHPAYVALSEAKRVLLDTWFYFGGAPHHRDDCPGGCRACEIGAAIDRVLDGEKP